MIMHKKFTHLLLVIIIIGIVLVWCTTPSTAMIHGITDSNSSNSAFIPGLSEQIWTKLGGPQGGLGYDIRMRPDNPDIMFVTDAWAGIHSSIDGGLNWRNMNEGITARAGQSGDAIPVFCATFDPNNNDIIWVGTQNTRGVYRSENAGNNWEKRTNGIEEDTGITFRGITVEPGNSNVVYAAAEISSFKWAGQELPGAGFDKTKGVVYKSTDAGRNWQAIWRGDNLARYIWINPDNTDIIYVSTGIFDREAANTDVSTEKAGGVGILKSIDGGLNWQIFNEANGLTGLYVGSLFMHPENPDILLAGVGHDYWSRRWVDGEHRNSDAGVFLSSDGGETWIKTLDDSLIMSVEFCVSEPNIAYAAGDRNFYRSMDGGKTWWKLNHGDFWGPPGIMAAFPIDIQVDPRDAMRLFVNNYQGGNFLSTDGGETWVTASNGYSGAQISGGIAVDSDNSARIYVGALSGMFRSNDGGETLEGLTFPPARFNQINAVATCPDNFNLVIKSPWDMGNVLAHSHDRGQSWELVEVDTEEIRTFVDIAFAPSDPEIVYAATGKVQCKFDTFECEYEVTGGSVYVSHDTGLSWQSANDSNIKNQNLLTLAVHPLDPLTVYAGTANNGIYKTTDGGKRWRSTNKGLRSHFVRSLAIDPKNPETVYLGTASNGLYFSRDGGENWVWSSAGMNPGESINTIVINPIQPSVIYAGSLVSGVYLSDDKGSTWQPLNEGLETRTILTMAISSDGKVIYAGTQGAGLFRLGEIPPEALAEAAIPSTTEPVQPETTVTKPGSAEDQTPAEPVPEEDIMEPTKIPPITDTEIQPTPAQLPDETEEKGSPWIFVGAGVLLLGLAGLGIWFRFWRR
jgi:photosystem II stability/assembly factor-like uncharacterized protein